MYSTFPTNNPTPQNLPNFVKGGCTVGACTYQSQAARAFHDDDEAGAAAAGGGADPSLVAVGVSFMLTAWRSIDRSMDGWMGRLAD